jgi:hypothetical protein
LGQHDRAAASSQRLAIIEINEFDIGKGRRWVVEATQDGFQEFLQLLTAQVLAGKHGSKRFCSNG